MLSIALACQFYAFVISNVFRSVCASDIISLSFFLEMFCVTIYQLANMSCNLLICNRNQQRYLYDYQYLDLCYAYYSCNIDILRVSWLLSYCTACNFVCSYLFLVLLSEWCTFTFCSFYCCFSTCILPFSFTVKLAFAEAARLFSGCAVAAVEEEEENEQRGSGESERETDSYSHDFLFSIFYVHYCYC